MQRRFIKLFMKFNAWRMNRGGDPVPVRPAPERSVIDEEQSA
jgi:hypothetical protein